MDQDFHEINSLMDKEKSISFQEMPDLAKTIAAKLSLLPQVVAVALSGSQTARSDQLSDFDFYVYTRSEISIDIRTAIARQFATCIEINNQFWEPGDEWIDTSSGRGVDIMYRTPSWIEDQLDTVLVKHHASVGFSTCFWWNVVSSLPLYDRDGWFMQLQQKANQSYPEPLRQAIVAKNYPILRKNISSYLHQLNLAVIRYDCISINHRTAALLASYFDIIFAVNYVPHPGEKRLIEFSKQLCKKLPVDMEEHIHNLINAISVSSAYQNILDSANALIDGLDELLMAEGLITESGQLAYLSQQV